MTEAVGLKFRGWPIIISWLMIVDRVHHLLKGGRLGRSIRHLGPILIFVGSQVFTSTLEVDLLLQVWSPWQQLMIRSDKAGYVTAKLST